MAPTAFWTFFVVNLVPMFYFVHMIVSSFACIITVNDGTFDASLLRFLEAHMGSTIELQLGPTMGGMSGAFPHI